MGFGWFRVGVRSPVVLELVEATVMALRRYDSRPLEKNVEESMRKAILKEHGVIMFRKNASAGKFSDKAFMDRTLFAHYGFTMHVEVKRLGEVANDDQEKIHNAMRAAGHIVYCLDNTPALIAAYREEYVLWLQRLGLTSEASKVEKLWGVGCSTSVSRRGKRASTKR